MFFQGLIIGIHSISIHRIKVSEKHSEFRMVIDPFNDHLLVSRKISQTCSKID